MNLSKRETNILIGGVVFLVLFLGYQLGIAPVFEKKQALRRAVVSKQEGIAEMNTLLAQYQSVFSRFDAQSRVLTRRAKDFSLFAFLDLQAQQSGVKESVDYMKPLTKKTEGARYSVATVKVKLKQVYLKQLVDFMHRIESSRNGVTITSLSLTKSGRDKDFLDAVLEAQTPLLKEGA